MRLLVILASFLLLTFVIVPAVHAQTVTSFTATPASIRSGGFVDFVWQLQNAGGYSFLIPCLPGIKLKYSNGNTLACGTKVSSTLKTNDYLTLFIHNVSGGTQNVTARLIPKDGNGYDQDALAKDVTVPVATHPQPVGSFTASATSTSPGKAVTISWASAVLDGVNLQIECRDEIKVSSPNYTAALYPPCGSPIFSSDLSPNSSISLNFTNSSVFTLPYKVTLLPAISPRSYDGTHAAYLTLDIASDILPDPVVKTLTASSTIRSREELKVSWLVKHAVGVNFKISCNSALITSSSPTGSALPCETYLFSSLLSASSTTSFWFTNSRPTPEAITLTLIPSKKAGEYDATRAKSITVTVGQQGGVSTSLPPPSAPPPTPSPSLPPPPRPTPPPSPSPPQPSLKKFVFTRPLKRGSKGQEVSNLQEFFKKDPLIYPEGLVTGYFGLATERAVGRFQKKYNVASPGVPGYGTVGPKTRAKLNALQ